MPSAASFLRYATILAASSIPYGIMTFARPIPIVVLLRMTSPLFRIEYRVPQFWFFDGVSRRRMLPRGFSVPWGSAQAIPRLNRGPSGPSGSARSSNSTALRVVFSFLPIADTLRAGWRCDGARHGLRTLLAKLGLPACWGGEIVGARSRRSVAGRLRRH